ncbi:universal stress protein [Cohnella endophytica]|uniref:Universal stress protein n=1 Tax=Cohnella endophytica TaxID=2419778 RepID=A0A494XQS6_9BACL|nr:universal stress protein [Cohnella endophytica]RKP52978.1 universal stress protein [Cohnella endophytica]
MIYHRIMVAYDGSKASEKALRHAVALAESKPGSRLTVAYVKYRPPFTVGGYGFIPPSGYDEQLHNYETDLLAKVKTTIASLSYAGVQVLEGNPAAALLDYAHANNFDLLVMGNRGMGVLREWVLGSVSHHVVQHARFPVLVVK